MQNKTIWSILFVLTGCAGADLFFEAPESETNSPAIQTAKVCEVVKMRGDVDGDYCVTNADKKILQDNMGSSNATYSMGDLTGDGIIDGADYTVWADAFQTTCEVLGPSLVLGDANGDGKVSEADKKIMNAHFLELASSANEGDFNGDGIVDGGDYTVWADNSVKHAEAAPGGAVKMLCQ